MTEEMDLKDLKKAMAHLNIDDYEIVEVGDDRLSLKIMGENIEFPLHKADNKNTFISKIKGTMAKKVDAKASKYDLKARYYQLVADNIRDMAKKLKDSIR